MKLVETKCPNCNSQIKVEPRKKIVCEYCGANFLLEDNTIQIKHIQSGEITEEQEFINAETNLNKLKNYKEAYDIYLSLSKRYVDDASIWIGLLRSLTRDFTYKIELLSFKNNYEKYWKNFIALADKKEIEKYESRYNDYISGVKFSPLENIKFSGINSKKKEDKEDKCYLAATALGGWFGLHKFLKGNIILGVIYLFTFGLYLIGWIYDIVKECKKWPESPQYNTIKWVLCGLFMLVGTGYIKTNIFAALVFFLEAFLVLDYIWDKFNINNRLLRVFIPLVIYLIVSSLLGI